MSEPAWHLAFVPMPPRPGEPPAPVRIRQLLKLAGRRFRLRCVSLREPEPDPTLWRGWERFPDGDWYLVCCHATEAGCKGLLAERGTGREGLVMPRGRVPG